MDGWVYTLTGFDDFFELRRVSFAEPMPASRICSLCGRLPSLTLIIPCGHVLCELCLAQIPKSQGCPFDGEKFSLADVRSSRFKRSELEQCRVFCCAEGSGYECGFTGQLSQLRNHLSQCGSGMAKCSKCLRPVVRRGLSFHHCLQCSGDSVPRKPEAAMAVGVRSTTDRRLASVNSDVDPGAAANGANVLTERVADLERGLRDVRKRCLDRVDERSSSPFRASKSRASLTFSKERHGTSVRFILLLRDGEWDGYLEWPFSKKVTLIIMHLRDAERDVRMPLPMLLQKMVKKPQAGAWNWGQWTNKIKWENIELRGFVDKETLYVNVEFE
ncbi:hypothetical protein HPB49_000699 [Dermacentor silvarum]|uniref:Uncharacterized protein n=1 Tax=Dermacentor silvarum TaxID=543639 RepID=A0ACB8DSF9_DERSI|nr:hypothetical protein HPB49_000699 [Dermacentor silvarum]